MTYESSLVHKTLVLFFKLETQVCPDILPKMQNNGSNILFLYGRHAFVDYIGTNTILKDRLANHPILFFLLHFNGGRKFFG